MQSNIISENLVAIDLGDIGWFAVLVIALLFFVSYARSFRQGEDAGSVTSRLSGGIMNMGRVTSSLAKVMAGMVMVLLLAFGVTDGSLIWGGGLLVGLDPVSWGVAALATVAGLELLNVLDITVTETVFTVIGVTLFFGVAHFVVESAWDRYVEEE